jgi:hypothetical protein
MIKNRMILGVLLFTVFGLMSAGSVSNNLANAGGDKRGGDGNCYKKGVSDGKDHPFNSRTFDKCGHDYYNGFIKGCTSVEGNTKDVCESATDA